MERRCIIVGAAKITSYKEIISRLNFRDEDFFIFCDGGLSHMEGLGVKPDLIVGDFDSFERPQTKVETIQLPCEKDDTDVFFAVKEAVKRGFKDFILLGVIGQRFDHSLCNISVLVYLEEHKCRAKIFDDYSEMELINSETEGSVPVVQEGFSYFSLMCIDGSVEGLSIKNAKYPLENAKLSTSYQYAISNEVIPGKTAQIELKKGRLLLIKVW